MRILQINAVFDISSTGKIASRLQEYINSRDGNICKTAFCYGGSKEDGYIIGSKRDRKIHGFLSRLSGKQGWFSKKATRKLLKYMEEFGPDVVQLGNLHGNYVNFPMLMKYIIKKEFPVVMVLNDCWFFTGKCCHYTVDNCYRWQTGCGNCVRLRKDNKSWIFDKTFKLWKKKKDLYEKVSALAIVGVSDWITEEAKKSPLFKEAKTIRRIYNGIDGSVFYKRESDIRKKYDLEDKKIILAVSYSWAEAKGLKDILKLSSLIDDDCRIVIIGKLDCELPHNIIHIPATDDLKVLSDWYNAADVFITMSKEESFGMSAAEALMCGAPVVRYSSTANSELVGENCGYVCESNDIYEFKRLVEKVLTNGKESYKKACIEYAEENFNEQKNFDEYLNLYQELTAIEYKKE